MAEETKSQDHPSQGQAEAALHVSTSPHVVDRALTTRRMMLDVLIALVPVVAMAVHVFGLLALKQLGHCILSCLVAEAVFTKMRRRPLSLFDFSAVVTGVILALSIPGTAPWYVGVIGGFVAVGLGKVVFGGLGGNIFNPAMVGRAFVMIAFPVFLGASGYVDKAAEAVQAVSRATPMNGFKQAGVVAPLWQLFWGTTNGSIGETSALMCIIGGLYLCIRRTASWEIPAGMILAAAAVAGIVNLTDVQAQWTALHHVLGGALLFGAFFIATDPVTSPLTPAGKFIFGAGIGAIVMLLRLLSGYPEGVMFAVLLMNSLVPLINRWTVPRPVGGPVPTKK